MIDVIREALAENAQQRQLLLAELARYRKEAGDAVDKDVILTFLEQRVTLLEQALDLQRQSSP